MVATERITALYGAADLLIGAARGVVGMLLPDRHSYHPNAPRSIKLSWGVHRYALSSVSGTMQHL